MNHSYQFKTYQATYMLRLLTKLSSSRKLYNTFPEDRSPVDTTSHNLENIKLSVQKLAFLNYRNLVVNLKFEKKQNRSLAPPTSNNNSGLVTPILHLFAGCPNDPSVSGLSTLRRDPRSWLVGRLATLDHQCIRHRFKMFQGSFL